MTLTTKIYCSRQYLPVFGIVRQHTSARNICSFFNAMHFKLNYDQVFNDNDI
jgi:hypothetical protein